MKKLYILQLGAGNVGGTLIQQITSYAGKELMYCGVFTSKEGVFRKTGLSKKVLSSFLQKQQFKHYDAFINIAKVQTASRIAGMSGMTTNGALAEMPEPFVLIDTTASHTTLPLMKRALQRGGYVVMSNKKPIAGTQKDFDALHKLGADRLFYETTVGAGLPVISTLRTLLSTGDEVLEIQGCFSGTLGFLFSQVENGASFSDAVLEAKKLGFTEPDPRDDLSGVDVARKALIVARLLGMKLEMSDVKLEGLYPKKMSALSVDEFLAQLTNLDTKYKEKAATAQKQGKVLRFIATVSKDGCNVGLEAVEKTSDIGSLSGPDNLIVFKTKRYYDNPLVIKGPGAGREVTAAGVFGDLLAVARNFNF